MATEPISFYFTLFKKFEVLGHVNEEVAHGDPANPTGFSLKDPASVKAFAAPGNTTPSSSLIYTYLSNGTMPLGATQFQPPAWVQFESGGNNPPPNPTLVQDLATWITAGSVYDIPAGVITQIPANPPGQLIAGVSPYVFSVTGDTGARNLPNNTPFWATSLILLVDGNGNIQNPSTLTGEYWLCAVIGNNGDTDGGQWISAAPGGTYVQAQAYIMVFNTVMGPGVQLPSLSNLDPNDTTGVTYDQYFLWNGSGNDQNGNAVYLNNTGTYPNPGSRGCYDVVGFRFNVQNTFNNLVTAVQNAINNNQLTLPPGVTTAQQFVLGTPQSPAHACAKVLIGQGQGGATFPPLSASPLTTATIAQKNLAPFNAGLGKAKHAIKCVHFVIGQPDFIPMPGAGQNILSIETKLSREQFRFYLSFRKETFARLFGEAHKDKVKGFRQVAHREIAGGAGADLTHDAVVLQYEGGANRIEIPPFPNNQFHGVTMCMEYDSTSLRPGNLGEINLVHRAMLPRLVPGTRCFEIEETVAGGFTLQVRAFDPFSRPKAEKR